MASGPITRLGELLRKTRQEKPFGNDAAPNSLFGEILDWMLAPLLILWPVSIAATNHVANNIANQPYDQALAENVLAISEMVNNDGKRLKVVLPASAQKLLHTDEIDTQYHQVRQFDGTVAYGDPDIPLPTPEQPIVVGQVLFRDVLIGGESVRVAYSGLREAKGERMGWVQVAETRHKREQLASRIISGVLLPQFAIIPLAVILVYIGLTRGIRPLSLLQARIRRRRPTDLSQIPIERTPEEVQPLVLAFNEMMARLELNLQAQQRFIADAAHQMRTPLTGLKMQAELALSEPDPARMREALALIGESTDRAAHLINQLLVLARAEASHEKVHRVEPVDLNSLARSVTQEWFERALARKIDLGFETDHWPLMIEGVPLLLRELLSNLIDNAVKYTPDGGRVTVRTRGTEFAVLEVEDSGIGIAPEERERIFERFYRTLGTDVDGSGLGLPIVAEIAELHRALIVVTSADGGGSLFRVSFARRGGVVSPVDLRPE
jgi:two-component system sensor histidine kinase TctE